jgi:hypothetical protein
MPLYNHQSPPIDLFRRVFPKGSCKKNYKNKKNVPFENKTLEKC